MSRPTWTRTAVKAARTAWLTGQIASTVGTATELPKPLAEQYSDYTTQVRTEQTRKERPRSTRHGHPHSGTTHHLPGHQETAQTNPPLTSGERRWPASS